MPQSSRLSKTYVADAGEAVALCPSQPFSEFSGVLYAAFTLIILVLEFVRKLD